MADGFAELDAQIARLRGLGSFARDAAPDVADALREELEKNIAAGVSPDGSPWLPRKEDGGQPLANAAAALVVVPVGTSVFARIRGHHARHHKGTAKGGRVRRILPTNALSRPAVDAIKRVLAKRFGMAMEVSR